jgi:hypothetical protein
MIDTVNLSILCPMHRRDEMLGLGFSPTCGHPDQLCRHLAKWKLDFPISPSAPHITWIEAPDRLHWLTVSVSLPKMLFGSNVQTLKSDEEISSGLQAISKLVSECSSASFDALSANVSRVDFCHDWHLTPTEVLEYLKAIGGSSLPRMTRCLIDDGTAQFSNKSEAVVVYDKFQEVMFRLSKGSASHKEVSASVGVLRLENRFRKRKACQRLAQKLSLPDAQAKHLLTSSVAIAVLTDKMSQLGLDGPLETSDERLTRLREFYGFGPRFFALAGFMTACDKYGAEKMVALGMGRANYYRKRRDLQRAGVWLTSFSKGSLAPLRLSNDWNKAKVA